MYIFLKKENGGRKLTKFTCQTQLNYVFEEIDIIRRQRFNLLKTKTIQRQYATTETIPNHSWITVQLSTMLER